MRAVFCLVALVALLLAGARAQMPPPPTCTVFSPTVYASNATAAGTVFTTAASCPSSDVAMCNCIVHASTVNNVQYGATNTRVVDGDTCTCTFVTLRDTPAHVLSFDNCVACA